MSPDYITDPRITQLSYSSLLTLHECPRKYLLSKVCKSMADPETESESLTFAFGHTVGEGIQKLICGVSLNQVILNALLTWETYYTAENLKQNKSIWQAIYALKLFSEQMDFLGFSEWQAAEYNSRPAAELGFRIAFEEYPGVYFRGFVDLVMKHRTKPLVRVLEVKTSSSTSISSEAYKNSAQGTGYSVVLDKISPESSSYEVLYLIYLTKEYRFELMSFNKSLDDRAAWLLETLLEVQRIDSYQKVEHFPKHGESCSGKYYSSCKYFQSCDLSIKYMANPYVKENDPETKKIYDFEFSFEDLFETQQSRVEVNL
jgi:hypothetical protein